MNPVQKLELIMTQMMMSLRKTELFTLGLFSIELARIGQIEPERLKNILDHIMSQLESEGKDVSWPGPKNLAA